MSEILAKSIRILLVTMLLFLSLVIKGQNLSAPELKFSTACSQGSNIDFGLEFKISGSLFEVDNVFQVELSDEDGNFTSTPDRFVSTIVNKNNTFLDIPATFQLPEGTNGSNYRVRIVASNPEVIGPSSEPFPAYDMVEEDLPTLTPFDLYICGNGGDPVEIILDTEKVANYSWYRNGVFFRKTNEPRISVNSEGNYEAILHYGVCGNVTSFNTSVSVVQKNVSNILGQNEIEICSDETHTFEAEDITVPGVDLTYNWYKDGELVTSSASRTYTTPNTRQFGTYHLEVHAGNNCTFRSQDIILRQKSTASFTIINSQTEKDIILPGETKELTFQIEPASTSVEITWFKDGEQISVFSQILNAIEPGKYYARVTETAGASGCRFSQDSEVFELVGIDEFDLTIRTSNDYVECDSDATNLVMVGVTAIGTDGEEYQLSDDQINENLNYQWFKNGVEITGANDNSFNVPSYEENGVYKLNASIAVNNTINSDSNDLDVKLTVASPEILSTSTSNSLCDGGTITLSFLETVTGFTYTWFKDNEELTLSDPKTLEINEPGEYRMEISGFGCLKELDPITIIPFDDSAVQVTPSEIVVLLSGEATEIRASGAESYEWYEEDSGDLLSTNETVEVNKIGLYSLIARVDDCQVIKTIEVVEQDDQIIVPNIISPKILDGINDTWQISNRYSYQPTVTISIYNASGKEVLTTTEYKNDWPKGDLGNQRIFYYKIIRDEKLIKAGSISVID